LSEDQVCSDVARTAGGVKRCQRMVVFEHAIVDRVGDEQIPRTVEADAERLAHVGGTWQRVSVSRRAGACDGREAGAAAPLAEDEIRGRVPCAGRWIERRQRLIEFENARVLKVGDEQVAHRIDGQPARAA
jgi:hypothetical protein